MIYKPLAGILAAGLMLSACSKETNETVEGMKALKDMTSSLDDVSKTQNVINQRFEERKAKGDTLVMPTEELKKFLPADIAGYTSAEPEYNVTTTPGLSLSMVSRTYTTPDGRTLKISLTDYNGAQAGYMGLTAVFTMQFRTESATSAEGTFQTNNPMIAGMDKLDKQSKMAQVQYGLGGRFHLMLETNTKSVDELRKLAEGMDLAKLASL